jgi:hypothetical protein
VSLTDNVRTNAADIAAGARWVEIDVDRLDDVEPGPPPELDPETHYLEGDRADVAAYLLMLDSINFGSGWFPTLNKREGKSGYFTVAWGLADRFRADGPYSNDELRDMTQEEMARTMGQREDHPLMKLFAQALTQLGEFLGERTALEAIEAADGSAERLAQQLADGMPFFDDRGFYKRAQITPQDLQIGGIAEFTDIDKLTIFADNLVPHVLRVDGVLRYHPDLAAHIDAERLLEPGEQEREIRACAVHACEQIAARLDVPPRTLDMWLWNRGQGPRYKSRPRHRTRTVFY